jgi:DNA topoisomerase-3
VDFSGQEPLGPCPKCGASVFETAQSYVCEKAVGPGKACDFRSGRVILQRPVERPQMQKLLATGKTDLLQFVSARTKRGFSAFLVRQPDGKIGFEFEAKEAGKGKGARGARGTTALRVLGAHPKDGKPVELHAGRYGPYVKHGSVNATLPDRDRADALTLDQAVALLEARAEREGGAPAAKKPRKTAAASGARPAATKAPAKKPRKTAAASGARPAATKAPAKKVPGPAAKTTAKTAAKTAPRTTATKSRPAAKAATRKRRAAA